MEETWSLISSAIPYLVSLLAFLFVLEQIKYLKKKNSVPGPSIIIPYLGNAISMVRNQTLFWDTQAALAKSSHLGISANYIMGKFIIFAQSSDVSHTIFTNVRPDGFQLLVNPFGKKFLADHNLIYLMGQEHRDARRRIAPNFSPRALSTYANLQQMIILKHLKAWLDVSNKSPASIPLHELCMDLSLDTSLKVFVGPYLTVESKERFSYDYSIFNVGSINVPVDLPGFAFRKAKFALSRLVQTLAGFAELSQEKMKAGEEPTCLIDFWMQDNIREITAAAASEKSASPHSSTREIAGHVFDFLFASQGPTTSSLLWSVTLLDSHPEILSKVRQEVCEIWQPESGKMMTAEQLKEMKYTEAVATEVVRIRAPVAVVPHIACADFRLSRDYTIPKGTIVFPSTYESSFQGFTDPEQFDPDRFMPDRHEDQVYKKNFLTFGAGSHQCVG